MNSSFDKEIKAMIKHENYDIPNKLKNEIKIMLESLPEDNRGLKKETKKRYTTKIILIASVIVLLIMTTAFAAMPELLKMTQNFIENLTKIDNVNILSKQEEFEKYSAPVNYTSESEGISVTIDNIAVDGNFLLISSTITCNRRVEDIIKDSWVYKKFLELRNENKSKDIIEKFKDSPNYEQNLENLNNLDYKQFLVNISPYYYFKIDGFDYGRLDKTDNEEYIENEYTFITVQKYIIPAGVPDIFKLSISEKYICNIEGKWSFDIMIDRSESKKNSISVMPGILAEVTSIASGKEYKHNVTIDSLSISPFGGQITLSEKGPEVFRDFTLRDKDNNYYMVLNDAVISSKDVRQNTFEFIYSSESMDINELELVPILTYGNPTKETVRFEENVESTDIKISDIGGYTVQSVMIDNNKIKITLKPYGVILHYRSIINGAFGIVDKNGEDANISFENIEYDKRSGNAIVTIICNNVDSHEILNEISGFWYIKMPDMQLNEKEVIKIPLK